MNVLSTPKITSASGVSLVRMARVNACPASPCLMNCTLTLFACSNCCSTASLRANDSCVKTVNVRAAPLGAGSGDSNAGVASGDSLADVDSGELGAPVGSASVGATLDGVASLADGAA